MTGLGYASVPLEAGLAQLDLWTVMGKGSFPEDDQRLSQDGRLVPDKTR